MTKLQLLHRALNERLMAAVEQIMEMVGGTVLEYEEETVRARRENEVLRRRLRWLEAEIHTDWPGPNQPTDFCIPCEVDPPGLEEPGSLAGEPVLECMGIKTEPTDAADSQQVRRDVNLTSSGQTANLETVNLGTSEPPNVYPHGVVWDTAHSYMAPLEFDPTSGGHWRGRARSQRMSFACPECGKVFGREQRLIFHMRIHSSERPYTYRRRKACFYGDKKQKRKPKGLSKVYKSREFVEDLSDSSEQTEQSIESPQVSAPTTTAPSAPEIEPDEESDGASENTANSNAIKCIIGEGVGKSKWPRCIECRRAFKTPGRLSLHMKTHRKPFLSQDQEQEDPDKTNGGAQQNPKKPIMKNNELELKRARARGHTLFQCSECKKIFARSCWLTFHLKSHQRERTLAHLEQKRKQKQLRSNEIQKSVTEILNEVSEFSGKVAEESEIGFEQPVTEISEHNNITFESNEDCIEFEFETCMDESSEIRDESEIIPEESAASAISKKSQKICKECGKLYLSGGWLKTHMKIHERERKAEEERLLKEKKRQESKIRSQRRRRRKMGRVHRRKQTKVWERVLVEKMIENCEERRKNELVEHSLENIRQTMNQDANGMVSKGSGQQVIEESEMGSRTSCSNRDQSSKIGDESKIIPKASTAAVIKKSRNTCQECGKSYLHSGWLKTHMKVHERERIIEEERLYKDKRTYEDMLRKAQRRQRKMRKLHRRKQKKALACGLVEKLKESYEESREKELVNVEHGLDNIAQTMNQDTHGMVPKDSGQQVIEETPATGIAEHMNITLESNGHPESRTTCSDMDQSSEIRKESEIIPEEPTALGGRKTAKICPECGKYYLNGGWLKTHMKIHESKRMYKEELLLKKKLQNEKQKMKKKRISWKETEEHSLVENLEENELVEVGLNPDNIRQTVNQDADGMGSSTEDSTVQKEKDGGNHPCPFCDKVFRRGMRLMVHMQIHTGEKPYSYRKRKEQFYGDPSRPRVAGPDSQEPVIESSDEREKDGRFTVTRNQTSAVSQDHTSTSEPMETVQPHTVCTGRKLNPLPLQSTGAASMNRPRPNSKPVSITKASFNLQPRIVLKPITVVSQPLHVKQRTARPEIKLAVDVEPEHSETSRGVKSSLIGGTVNDVGPAVILDTNSDDKLLKTVSECSSICVQQVANPVSECADLSDVCSDADEDDWSDLSNNLDEKKTSKGCKMQTGHFGLKDAVISQSSVTSLEQRKSLLSSDSQNPELPSSSQKATDALNRDRHSDGQKSSSVCTVCGLMFANKASLSQHMQVHSSESISNSSSLKAPKMRTRNTETKITQQVQVQTSEVHEDDSTDCREKSDSTTPLAAKTAKSSRGHSNKNARSQSSKGSSKTPAKSKGPKKERKVIYCLICSKACRKIDLHVKYDHPREPAVIEALRSSKTAEEREKLLSRLCCRKSSDCHNTDPVMLEDFVNCLFCQGSYKRNQFWKHALICEPKEATDVTPQNTTQKTLPESVNAALPEVEPNAVQKSCSSVSQSGNSEKTADPVSEGSPVTCIGESTQESAYCPLNKKEEQDIEPRSTSLENEACSNNGQKTLDSGSSNIEKSTGLHFSSQQTLECSGNKSPPELEDHLSTNSQLNTDQKSQRTTSSTANESDLQKTFCKQIPPADHEGDPNFELAPDPLSVPVQKTCPETENPCPHVLDSSENQAPNLQSDCSPVLDCIPIEKQLPEPEQCTQSSSGALEVSGSECHIKEDLKTARDCEFGVLDSTPAKRKQYSQCSEFQEAKTKRRRQSDPSQHPSAEENAASETIGHTSEMVCESQSFNPGSPIGGNSEGNAQVDEAYVCFYCNTPCLQMAEHLQSVHPEEPEVAKALGYDENSRERKQLLDLLQNKGKLLQDTDVTMSGFVPSEQTALDVSNEDCVHCIYCRGIVNAKSVTNHLQKCKVKHPDTFKNSCNEVLPVTKSSSPIFTSSCSAELNADSGSTSSSLLSEESVNVHLQSAVSSNTDNSCGTKQQHPDPESVRSLVSDLGQSVLESTWSPNKDFTPDNSLDTNEGGCNYEASENPCSSPDDDNKTSESKDSTAKAEKRGKEHCKEEEFSCSESGKMTN